jgi:REP element-mobilizing transposase RayT
MIHAYHVILGAYGYWLPNDPRGSWSDFVAKWELVRFGKTTRQRQQRSLVELTPAELAAREAARRALKYPPVRFTGLQARAIARGFANACQRSNYTIWACAILPEHTHLVIARHRYRVEQIANLLKGAASRQLTSENIHPLRAFAPVNQRPPTVWGEKLWKVYLDSEEAIENAIRYVEQNPVLEDKPLQNWSFVTPFAGLPHGWVTYH